MNSDQQQQQQQYQQQQYQHQPLQHQNSNNIIKKTNIFGRNRSSTNSSNFSPFAIPTTSSSTTTTTQTPPPPAHHPSHSLHISQLQELERSESNQNSVLPQQSLRRDTTTSKPIKKLTGSSSIPKLRRASSKVFNQFPHPFTSSSTNPSIQPSPHQHPTNSNRSQESLIETIQVNHSAKLIQEPSRDNLSDYDPITPADIRSFEDDGQEGSLQDALDIGDPNSLTDTIVTLTTSEDPPRQSLLSSSNPFHQYQQHHHQQPQPLQYHQLHQHHYHQHQPNQSHSEISPPSSQPPKPGKQHGAFPYPGTPPPKTQPNQPLSISPSKQASLLVRQLTKTSKMLNHHQNQNQITNQHQASSSSTSSASSDQFLSATHPLETHRRPPKPSSSQPSRDSPLSIVASGPAALPSRLSGWFQHAFSSSSSHLPLLNPTPALTSPRSPEKIKTNQQKSTHSSQGHSTPPDDYRSNPVVDPRRSPNSHAHLAPSTNIRGLGNFFDKAVNYMFDTDAHSYDSRLTAELWIIGGQQFSGVWKWEEVQHDESPYEDLGMAFGNPGTGSGSDASHNPPLSLKKRTGLRRVTVGKTKAIFKHHSNSSSLSHHSPPQPARKSVELALSARKNPNLPLSPSSSTPSPEPSVAINHHRNDDPTLLSPLVTHSYPPLFYHAFASIIGLTYRTDFPPIPCTSDRSKSSAIGAAGARVGGMLASLSLSIGRTGKKPRSGQGGSRSPSPHRHLGDRIDEDDRTSDSAPPRGLSTDVGWGCMLRTGQSMLANALLVTHLGRDWRRPITSITSPSISVPVDPLYARLLSWFIDSSSPLAPFSVHHFTSKGKELGKEVGEWFGPSTAAGAIKALTNQFMPAGIGVATDVDGTVYRSDVFSASSFNPTSSGANGDHTSSSIKTSWQRPVLVLINARLGLDGVNPVYYDAIKATFTFPQSVGIAGGRPSSSYYFCGHQGDSLFYIDPHHSRPAIPFEEPPKPLMFPAQRVSLNPRTSFGKQDGDWEQISSADTDSLMSGSAGSDGFGNRSRKQPHAKNSDRVSFQTGNTSSISINLRREQLDDFYAGAYPSSAFQTFHPEKVRRMNLTSLDPSMLLGFLVKDEADWEDLTARIRSFKPPLFHIAEVTPAWMRSNVDPAASRASTDFRPSDDSDLGIDSWSEPEGDDWGTNSRTDDHSSSGPASQSTGMDEHDEGLMEGAPDDTESSTNVDSISIDDEGWDNVECGTTKLDRRKYTIPPTREQSELIGLDNPSNEALNKLVEPDSSGRGSSRNAHSSSHGRAQSVNVQQSFPQGTSTIRSVQHLYRHSSSLSEGDGDQAEVINCLNRTIEPSLQHYTKPSTAIMPPSAFPTCQLAATAVSPTHSIRDEPRARNISAATVRARHSDEQLADSEETLNHQQRRRLDSQGSLRALRA